MQRIYKVRIYTWLITVQLRIESRGQNKGRGDWRDVGYNTYERLRELLHETEDTNQTSRQTTPFGRRYSWKPKSKYWKVARARLVSIHWACLFQPSNGNLAVLVVGNEA